VALAKAARGRGHDAASKALRCLVDKQGSAVLGCALSSATAHQAKAGVAQAQNSRGDDDGVMRPGISGLASADRG
jgi:hypothetical protein